MSEIIAAPATDTKPGRWQRWSDHLGTWVVAGLIAGCGAGLFFGEYCAILSIIGDAFVGLLRMTVLPYIATTLIANLGRQSLQATRRLASIAACMLLILWTLTLAVVCSLPSALPPAASGSFYSSAVVDPATGEDLVATFIPANIFSALADNRVPAIIVFCIGTGLALATVPAKADAIALLDLLASVLMKVAEFIANLAPFGVFAISASVVGTITFEEATRLQAYFVIYAIGSCFIAFLAFPLLIVSFTSLRYGQVIRVVRDPMITAFVTGKLIIVLPMLIKNTERLMAEHYEPSAGRKHEVEMLYTTAYAFPHAGKLLTLVFIPFVAWFFGNEMVWWEYPSFLLSGVSAYFAGPIVAVPFLLDQMQLPHDMFQLFLLTGVIGERIGDSVGAMHLATFALVTLAAMKSLSRLSFISVTKYIAVVSITGAVTIGIASVTLSQMATTIESKSEVLAKMQLIEEPAQYELLRDPGPNPVSLQPGETVMERIRRRGIMRVGYNEDKVPFAYFDEGGDLVGFDVNLAHALARDLGVSIEFVRFDRATLIEQVQADHFDFVMSGLVGTLERSEAMRHSASYMDVTLGLVVPDYRVRQFESLDEIRKLESPRIGFVDLSRGFVARLEAELPEAQLVEIENNRDFFEVNELSLDALLISAESGSAFTLFYPDYEVAVPSDFDVKLPLFYVLAGNDNETRDFIDHWVQLRTKDGTFDAYYQHWILGQRPTTRQPRWSILRNVLHWVH